MKNDFYLTLHLKKIFIFLFLFFLSFSTFAQINTNFREKQITLSFDTLIVDSLSIIPHSLHVFNSNGQLISNNKYQINYFSSFLVFDSFFVAQNIGSTIKLRYRVFTQTIIFSYNQRDTSQIVSQFFDKKKNSTIFNSSTEYKLFDSELKKEGNISREISIGNKQDLVLNSNFNLQLSGQLTPDISIITSISETNIPFQAEGNTQQLQEFDKMFIQLSSSKHKLIVGDFEISSHQANFLKLNKKVKGASFEAESNFKKNKYKSSSSASISKGTYHRFKIQGIENNQGPYRLYGIYNEMFIIILSGSEKVFLNGKSLVRGSEFDYTIDYNKAEIQFNNTVLITKDSRIEVEFEYSEQNYVRFNFFSNNEFSNAKASYGFNFYSEKDSKTQTINQELSENEKKLLSEIGNNIENAYIENAEKIDFDDNYIFYKKSDTIVNNQYFFPIYVYTIDYDTASYKLGFTFVGQNKGNYQRENSIINGKIYKWVAPINNMPQGDYEPIKMLITPKQKQMLSFWAKNYFGKKLSSNIEIALSNNDLNTFSNFGNSNTKGSAFSVNLNFPSEKYLVKMKQLDSISGNDSTNFEKKIRKNFFSSSLKYQFVQANFSELENFRETEFERNWNLVQKPKGNENNLNLQLNFQKADSNLISYNADYYNIGYEYFALKNSLTIRKQTANYRTIFIGSYLFTFNESYETRFIRYNSEIERFSKKTSVGIAHNLEYNLWQKKHSDSLKNDSYSFFDFDIFLKNKSVFKNKWSIVYKLRNDFLPDVNYLKNNSLSQEFNANLKVLQNKNSIIKGSIIFRKLELKDTLDSNIEPQNSFRTQLEHTFKFRKNFLLSSFIYDNFTGLELQREYSYFEVSKGQGNYVWKDYNSNLMKELDEFEISNFQYDADFIRIWLPSNNYKKVYGNKLNFSVKIDPKRIWNNQSGIRHILSNFSDNFVYSFEKKTDILDFIPFFLKDKQLDYLQALNSSIRNIFSFNKSKRVFNFDYVYINNKVFLISANGYDFSQNKTNEFKFKLLLFDSFILLNDLSWGKKQNSSEYLLTRNYSIDYKKNNSTLSYQYDKKYKFDISFSIVKKQNQFGLEKSIENKFTGKIIYSVASKSNLNISADYVRIKFNSEIVNSLSYIMLEGLLPGNNLIWNITFLKSISKSLQLNFNYSGRTNKSEKIIHSGSLQVKALF